MASRANGLWSKVCHDFYLNGIRSKDKFSFNEDGSREKNTRRCKEMKHRDNKMLIELGKVMTNLNSIRYEPIWLNQTQ